MRGAIRHIEPLLHSVVTTAQELDATQVQTPSITKLVAHLQTLSATQTQTPLTAEVVAHLRALAATQTQTPTIATVVAYLRTLAATETQTPAIGSGDVHIVELDAVQTQEIQILVSRLGRPTQTVGRPKKRETYAHSRQMNKVSHQTATLDALLVAADLSLLEDDEVAVLLLV